MLWQSLDFILLLLSAEPVFLPMLGRLQISLVHFNEAFKNYSSDRNPALHYGFYPEDIMRSHKTVQAALPIP